jgi:hypothetical protein
MMGLNGSPTPLWEQLAILIAGPPVMSCLWWLRSRGWAKEFQGADVSEQTKRRQRIEFWGLLLTLYLISVGTAAYILFIRNH